MRFKEFMQLTELDGYLGNVANTNTTLSFHRLEKRINTTPHKGTSVGRTMAAGKVTSPSRPVGLVSPVGPMTIPSVIKKS